MKIIFFGSDDFARAYLEALCCSPHQVAACVTPPDKPRGRGMRLSPAGVKVCACQEEIPVFQPDDVNGMDFRHGLDALKADVFVVIAFGRKLPDELINMPARGAVNVHASSLPKYRGAAPVNWAIIRGETETGLTVFRLNNRVDGGDILAQKKMEIYPEDTSVTLRSRMMEEGPVFLIDTLDKIEQGVCTLTPQREDGASAAPKLTKETGRIDWSRGARDIKNLARGLLPWPAAFTFYNGKILKILSAEVVRRDSGGAGAPGTVLDISRQGILVAAGRDNLLLTRVHYHSSRPMSAHEFAIGHKTTAAMKFS